MKIYTGYGDGYHTGDIHNVRISNVISEKAKYALMVKCEAENIATQNIVQKNPEGEIYFNG